MMKIKKALSGLLAMTMMVTLWPSTAYAKIQPIAAAQSYQQIVNQTEITDDAVVDDAVVNDNITSDNFTEDVVLNDTKDFDEEAIRVAFASPAPTNEEVIRYTVLAIDTSGSMRGTPMSVAKSAAIKFCESIINAEGKNYVALVTLNSSSNIICDFTDDIDSISSKVSSLSATGGTNVGDALAKSEQVLKGINTTESEKIIKNIVLLSDGLPEHGNSSEVGPYTSSDSRYYQTANTAYNVAEQLKSDYYIYTLGFFHSLSGMSLEFGRRFMEDLQNAGYYDVTENEELEFTFGDIANGIINGKKEGTFYFPSGSTGKDYPATYYYDDNYFTQNASRYNASLATMSLCFELSAWGSNIDGKSDYSNKSRNAKALLTEIGFEDFETNDYFKCKPSEDSMGVVVAHKDITASGKKYTLIALATRGGGYEAEWAGNLTLGTSGQHEGFETASDEAYRFLSDYINRHKDEFQDNIKLWFAGYSRAAATVNLLAGRLNDAGQISGLTIDKKDLYAYCFEPPMGALQNQVTPVSNYDNIHNIVNPNDLVTKVAMKAWGFARYGVDEPVIPSRLTSSNVEDFENMMEKFKTFDTPWVEESLVKEGKKDVHIIDTFQAKKIDPDVNVDLGHFEKRKGFLGITYYEYVPNFNIDAHLVADDNKSMSAFLDDLIFSLAMGVGGRSNYVNKLQAAARLACAEFMGGGYESYKWEKVGDLFESKLKSNILNIAYAYVKSGVDGVEAAVAGYLLQSIAEAGINLAAYGSIPGALEEALNSIIRAVATSICVSNGNDLVTLAYNTKKLFPAHYPELCLSWLQMQDANYTPEGRRLFVINGYRIIHINCPVDVAVYNSKDEKVAEIIDNVPQKIENSMIVSAFSADGEKLVYLPADEDYRVEILATDTGVLNYSVNEFSYDTNNYAKIVNYYDIPIEKGDTLKGQVPRFSQQDIKNTGEGSTVRYALSTEEGSLTPDVQKTGEGARQAHYNVVLENNNEKGGTIFGGGVYTEGSFAQVSAVAFEKCEFEGWFVDDELVSKEANYRFKVDEEVTLTAHFKGERPTPGNGLYNLTVNANGGGKITKGGSGAYSAGNVAALVAVPDEGYEFVGWTASEAGMIKNTTKADTTFTMPAKDATITATFRSSGGTSGSSSGGSGTKAPSVQAPTVSVEEGEVPLGTLVTLSSEDKDAKIYYTIDGTKPTEKSIEYTEPIKIDKAMHLKCYAVSGKKSSSVVTVKYTISQNDKVAFKDKVETIKYIKAYKDKTFKPNQPITRYEVIESLERLLDIKKGEGIKTFKDVNDEYKEVVAAFAEAGIINGFEDGSFKGNQGLTRAEFVKIMSIILNLQASESEAKFTDTKGHWANAYINTFATLNYLKGYEDGSFKPNKKMTRAEFVTIVNRIIGVKADSDLTKVFSDLENNHWSYQDVMTVVIDEEANETK